MGALPNALLLLLLLVIAGKSGARWQERLD